MKRLLAAAFVVAAFTLPACSNSVDVTKKPDGHLCEQTTKNQIFGWTYSTDKSLRNCAPGE